MIWVARIPIVASERSLSWVSLGSGPLHRGCRCLQMGHWLNVNTSWAARLVRFNPFHRSKAVWYADSAVRTSLSAAAPLLAFDVLLVFWREVAFSVFLR